MAITSRPFGHLSDGTAVTLWTMTNESGLRAELLDYGATLRALYIPDRAGRPTNVVLGYNDPVSYEQDTTYYGATVGRYANRIAGASFRLGGETWQLTANEGKNQLHGGLRGFSHRMWTARPLADGSGLEFTRLSPDGEEGFPGALSVSVTFSWRENALAICYQAVSDRDTIVNLTNHSYFNLDGSGSVEDQLLQVAADGYTPVGEGLIPTGEVLPVAGSAMDFRTEKPIGRDLRNKEACVGFGQGYDTNLVLTGEAPAAVAQSPKSGIRMTMTTDQPGVQLYTPPDAAAFCLETQHHPDSPHNPQWPGCVLEKGELYHSETVYAFSLLP